MGLFTRKPKAPPAGWQYPCPFAPYPVARTVPWQFFRDACHAGEIEGPPKTDAGYAVVDMARLPAFLDRFTAFRRAIKAPIYNPSRKADGPNDCDDTAIRLVWWAGECLRMTAPDSPAGNAFSLCEVPFGMPSGHRTAVVLVAPSPSASAEPRIVEVGWDERPLIWTAAEFRKQHGALILRAIT